MTSLEAYVGALAAGGGTDLWLEMQIAVHKTRDYGGLPALAEVLGLSPQVDRVTLRRLGGAVVYQISAKPGRLHFINALSGEIFTITPDVAGKIAQGDLYSQASVLQIESVDRHSFAYPWPRCGGLGGARLRRARSRFP